MKPTYRGRKADGWQELRFEELGRWRRTLWAGFLPRLITQRTCRGLRVSTDPILIQFDPRPTHTALWCHCQSRGGSMSPTLIVISSDGLHGTMNNPHHSSHRQAIDSHSTDEPNGLFCYKGFCVSHPSCSKHFLVADKDIFLSSFPNVERSLWKKWTDHVHNWITLSVESHVQSGSCDLGKRFPFKQRIPGIDLESSHFYFLWSSLWSVFAHIWPLSFY